MITLSRLRYRKILNLYNSCYNCFVYGTYACFASYETGYFARASPKAIRSPNSPGSLKTLAEWASKPIKAVFNHKGQMESQVQTMAAMNGLSREQATILANKYNFSGWLRTQPDLGFYVPSQTLLEPGQPIHRITQKIDPIAHTGQQIRCKPLEGARGRDQGVFASKSEAVRFLLGKREPYVVQENLDGMRYMRYVAFYSDSGIIWRMAKAQGTKLEATDKPASVGKLLREAPISRFTKAVTAARNLRRLPHTLQPGESEILSVRKQFPNSPAEPELLRERIDPAMTGLMERIRGEFGENVRLFCFDVGISSKGLSVLEFQIPYLMLGYPTSTRRGLRNYLNFHRLVAKELGAKFIENLQSLRGKEK